MSRNPVLVEVTRGDLVESRHRGAVAVADSSGRLVESWGEVGRKMVPRSAVKPLQALALVESGAASAFDLGDEELALACASHSGEPSHVAAVGKWLDRIGLGADDLVCGGHPPLGAAADSAFSPLHDNCSGKHAAMLTTARALGEPTVGYERIDHPVQTRIRAILSDLGGAPLGESDWAVDGCGVPSFALPVAALARAMARFVRPDVLVPARADAARCLAAAMAAAPGMVGGTGRFDTDVIAATRGRVIVKAGAEGVHAAGLGRRGLGVAVKIDDGARRAAEAVMAALLDRLGGFDRPRRKRLAGRLRPRIQTRLGAAVGEIRVML
jgi:L-asparaginase II